MKKTLTEIIDQLRTLFWTIEENAGEIDDQLMEELDGAECEFSTKAENIAWLHDQMLAQSTTLDTRSRKLAAKSKSLKGNAARLKAYLLDAFMDLDIQKMPTLDFPQMGIRKTPARLDVFNENQLLNKGGWKYLIKQNPKLDTAKLKADVKNGVELPGVRLISGIRLHW